MAAADRQSLIEKAERQVGRGKLPAAIKEYRKILQDHPDDTSTLNRIGDLYVRLERVDQAIELFGQAAEHFAGQGFLPKAIAIFKKIVRLDPSRVEAGLRLAELQQHQGLTNEARTQYESVAKQYQQRNDSAAAVHVYRKMTELEPANPSHRLHLAELLQGEGELKEAMAQYREIANLMLAHGHGEEATQVCLKALDVDPTDLWFVSGAVRQLKGNGFTEQAERLLQAAIEKNPEAGDLSKLGGKESGASTAEAEAAEPATALAEDLHEQITETEEPAVAGDIDGRELEMELPELLIDDAAEMDLEAASEDVEFEIDLGELEVVAEEPVKTAPEAVGLGDEERSELLIEVDVLARYGLEDKAIEKLEELFEKAPEDLEVHQRLINLSLQMKRFDRVSDVAESMAGLATSPADVETWKAVEQALISEGFTVENGQVTQPEMPTPEPLEELETAPVMEAIALEDASWLEEVEAATAATEKTDQELFDDEEDFFDLASELEKELQEEEELADEELILQPEEQTLEEIIEGFKRGMEATVSSEDFDTHYNLGIAYREMGLVDEAIGEFQLAAKDPRYLVDCCSLLASCFMEKGFPELAIKWYQEGLESPTITEDETLGLWYELGNLYLAIGEPEQARERFVDIYGINSSYRDVSVRLEDLDQQ